MCFRSRSRQLPFFALDCSRTQRFRQSTSSTRSWSQKYFKLSVPQFRTRKVRFEYSTAAIGFVNSWVEGVNLEHLNDKIEEVGKKRCSISMRQWWLRHWALFCLHDFCLAGPPGRVNCLIRIKVLKKLANDGVYLFIFFFLIYNS